MHKALVDFLYVSGDGYGIFDARDQLVFANPALGEIFAIELQQLIGMSFAQIIRHCHQQQLGLNIEATDLDDWLLYAAQRRRSVPFRIFEADTVNGHWYLMSEQCNAEGAILLHAKDITEQKRLQFALQQAEQLLRSQANTDVLTGIANRRYFMQQAVKVLKHQQRTGAACSLLMLDIDFFKQLNDTHGHLAGDKALQYICQHIQSQLRDYDLFARYGGEEFVILLADIPAKEAVQVAERIQQELELHPIRYRNQTLPLQLSIGVAELQPRQTLTELLQLADKALYQAKAAGRNCCVVANSSAL
ncbi:GGDEF domain-containing protein [Alkalimonas amylolytica]|uniref:diguanylate cyclase n=1 Tax=Alkalimonas amylolytica TaxID=152573 RepID=A0A1H3XVZ2_ALKAM|nr:sensor domain-containing diguanylate cyclase [Alkalimonas amylolytica]SEA03556.1 diguanylate cyclase (GGDEF) domain-containing protein [Alkalimonas amylolytica]